MHWGGTATSINIWLVSVVACIDVSLVEESVHQRVVSYVDGCAGMETQRVVQHRVTVRAKRNSLNITIIKWLKMSNIKNWVLILSVLCIKSDNNVILNNVKIFFIFFIPRTWQRLIPGSFDNQISGSRLSCFNIIILLLHSQRIPSHSCLLVNKLYCNTVFLSQSHFNALIHTVHF